MKCNHDITITDDTIGYELVSCSKCGMKKTRVAAYVGLDSAPVAEDALLTPDGPESKIRGLAAPPAPVLSPPTRAVASDGEVWMTLPARVNGSSEGAHAIDGALVEGEG